MPTPADRALLKAVKAAATALGSAAVWATSKRPLNIADDFVYETFLYIQMLLTLKLQYTLQYIPGAGKTTNAFPKKPANKKGRPRFDLLDKNNNAMRYQLCAGTRIYDIHNKPRSPDISLQKATAGDEPGVADVLAIWDAKYKSGGDRITSHEFSEFARWLELLNLSKVKTVPIKLGPLHDLEGHCLVTNGDHSTECDAERIRTNVREVASFYPADSHSRKP